MDALCKYNWWLFLGETPWMIKWYFTSFLIQSWLLHVQLLMLYFLVWKMKTRSLQTSLTIPRKRQAGIALKPWESSCAHPQIYPNPSQQVLSFLLSSRVNSQRLTVLQPLRRDKSMSWISCGTSAFAELGGCFLTLSEDMLINTAECCQICKEEDLELSIFQLSKLVKYFTGVYHVSWYLLWFFKERIKQKKKPFSPLFSKRKKKLLSLQHQIWLLKHPGHWEHESHSAVCFILSIQENNHL